MTDMLAAALDYAAKGWPVFPCSPQNKQPMVPKETQPGAKDGGLYLATTDREQIGKWWRRWPGAMIGMPMGRPQGPVLKAASGAIVIDLDPALFTADEMMAGLRLWAGEALAGGPVARTRSGGLHLWFAVPEEPTGNRAGLFGKIADAPETIRLKVDVRSTGGYVIMPPSVMAEGTFYSWETPPGEGPLPPLPQRLLDAVLKRLDSRNAAAAAQGPAQRPPASAGRDDAVGDARRKYAMAALDRECRDLARVGEGARGFELNKVAYSLGGLVGAGILSERVAAGALLDACEANGLAAKDGAEKCRENIARSLGQGAAKPIDISQIGTRAGPPQRQSGAALKGNPSRGASAAPPGPSAPDSSSPPPSPPQGIQDGPASPAANMEAPEEADDPGEPSDAPDDIDFDMLRRCAAELQNDVGNSRRLRHRFGHEIIHVQNVAVFAWDGKRWAEDIDGRKSRPLCHQVADAIMLEPIVMAGSEEEAAAIEEAKAAKAPLADAKQRLAEADADKEVSGATRAERMAEIRIEIGKIEETVRAGREAMAAIRSRRASRRKWAVTSGNAGKVAGMLGEAIPYLSRAVSDLDTDLLAFNVGNGTLRFFAVEVEDLENPDPDGVRMKTEWRVRRDPHRREDMISKMADVEHQPGAAAPLFSGFIEKILPNENVRLFVQRFFGYGLTALTREQLFVLLHGEGSNGKSTLVDVVARMMADYSTSVPIATLVNDNRSGKGSEATPDLARLPGARLVRTAEPKEGMSFDESLIKGLTSGEPFPMRRLNKEFIDVYPTFKLVISANRKPTIKGNDDGIWRRVMMVPFDVQIPDAEKDKQLPDKLWLERSGILNWLVEGCLSYLTLGGLRPPPEVTAATREYREESDTLGGFARAAIIVTGNPADEVETGALYAAFVRYCERQAMTPFASTTFNRRLPKTASQFGFHKGKSSISLYVGIQIKPEFKPEPKPASGKGWHGGGGEQGGG